MDINRSRASVGEEDYSLITHEKCNPPRAKLCIVFLVSLVVAALIILLVVLTTINPPKNSPSNDKDHNCWNKHSCLNNITDPDQCADVAIVGAGLAGCYTAWRLRNSSKSVVIYEVSDRIGGRIKSHFTSNDSTLGAYELGASFFIPELHPRLTSTIRQLGLQTKPFADLKAANDVLYYLRGKFLRPEDIRNGSAHYAMRADEQNKTPLELLRYLLGTNTAVANAESLHTFLLERASYEAYQYLIDSLPWYEQSGAGNAEIFLDYVTKMADASLPDSFRSRRTVEGGMEAIVDRLISETREANPRFTVLLEREVVSVDSQPSYHVIHTLPATSVGDGSNQPEPCAKTVVFTLPPSKMSRITFDPENIQQKWRENLQKLTPVPLMRTVVEYTTAAPLWPHAELPWSSINTDLPIQSVSVVDSYCVEIDIFNGTNFNDTDLWLDYDYDGNETLPNYTDYTNLFIEMECKTFFEITIYEHHLEYWTLLLDRDGLLSTEQGYPDDDVIMIPDVTSSKFGSHLVRYLQEIVGNSANFSRPSKMTVKLWSQDRNSEAFFLWNPGVNWTSVMTSYWKPLNDVTLHLIGSPYSPSFLQLWCEGALYAVDSLLKYVAL